VYSAKILAMPMGGRMGGDYGGGRGISPNFWVGGYSILYPPTFWEKNILAPQGLRVKIGVKKV
jgi:hypothetical protein